LNVLNFIHVGPCNLPTIRPTKAQPPKHGFRFHLLRCPARFFFSPQRRKGIGRGEGSAREIIKGKKGFQAFSLGFLRLLLPPLLLPISGDTASTSAGEETPLIEPLGGAVPDRPLHRRIEVRPRLRVVVLVLPAAPPYPRRGGNA
jgi:hypothetical protein